MKKFTFLFLFLASVTAGARIINVPGDYPTIQQGIDSAAAGDTVLVADGVYSEQINFLGKTPLLVTSNFIFDGDSTHLFNTIIDGSELPYGNASVVKFVQGNDSTSVLAGFTIRNGRGTYFGSMAVIGGGIFLKTCGGKIIHNRIIDNIIVGDTVNTRAWGGGIGTNLYDNTNWIVIRDNIISDNTVKTNSINSLGAGIYIASNIICERNIISNNKSLATANASPQAAGICLDGGQSISITGLCRSNKIINNLAKAEAGGIYSAGFGTINSSIIFSDNEVIGNVADGPDIVEGSGASFYVYKEGTVIRKNYFSQNISYNKGGGLELLNDNETLAIIENNTFEANQAKIGGGIYAINANLALVNNVFYQNNATDTCGGAVYLYKEGTAQNYAVLVNNTFSENTALYSGGAVYADGCNPRFLNNIFWQDSAATGAEIGIVNGTGSIAYSNIDVTKIEGEMDILEGILSLDPLFCDTLCMPDGSSPCLDHGIGEYIFQSNDTLIAPPDDILGQPRPLDNGYDMGAYEVLMDGVDDFGKQMDLSVQPNPTTGRIICSYLLTKDSRVSLILYDILGRLKYSKRITQSTGLQSIPIDLTGYNNGIYLLKLEINGQTGVRKVVVNNE